MEFYNELPVYFLENLLILGHSIHCNNSNLRVENYSKHLIQGEPESTQGKKYLMRYENIRLLHVNCYPRQ